jgi:hypothetical protein
MSTGEEKRRKLTGEVRSPNLCYQYPEEIHASWRMNQTRSIRTMNVTMKGWTNPALGCNQRLPTTLEAFILVPKAKAIPSTQKPEF